MNDKTDASADDGGKRKPIKIDKVVPTLFIGVGGTGAQVLSRVRRRILSRVWTGGGESIRLDSLDDFPFAQFLRVDLDMNPFNEAGTNSDDPLQASIAFKPDESFVRKLDLGKYISSDEKLRGFGCVEPWFPLHAERVEALGIDPAAGAGQIRAISRLYFFDRYQDIRGAIKNALSKLSQTLNQSEARAKRLGLALMPGSLRVVVIASTAGGTGSGAFIDMGYLSKVLLNDSSRENVSSQLVLMLPSGYEGDAGGERTRANTYAALMELETCMRGGGASYSGKWSESDVDFEMPTAPYDDVYFLDTENVANEKTGNRNDCFDMAADVLFGDFATAEFASEKRSVAVNKKQHKTHSYSSRVDREKYGDLKLTFSRAYSAFGQSILDTQLEQRQTMVVERQISRMLGVFFGVSSEAGRTGSAQPTEDDRNDLLKLLKLEHGNEIVQYEFATLHQQFRKGAERTIAPIVMELLRVDGRGRLDDIGNGIQAEADAVKQAGDHKEWPVKFAELIKQIRRDAIRGVEAGTGLHEEGIQRQRVKLRKELMDAAADQGVIKALWVRVDNKEKGGLDFAIELIQRMKDRMDNAETGLASKLEEASKWFADLSGYINNTEIAELKEHLDQAVGKWVGGKAQSEAKWEQLTQAAKAFTRYHLISVACREAAALVRELSADLGSQQGTDANGAPVWAGFIGELERGRVAVRQLMGESQTRISRLQQALKQDHAMYLVLPAPRSGVDELDELPATKLREWAEEVFRVFGGTQDLFKKLESKDGRGELTGKLRNQALNQIAQWNRGRGVDEQENPLFGALEALPPGEREQVLQMVMQRAMPWAPLRLDRFLLERTPEDQYTCKIGVKDSKKFEIIYGDLLRKKIPSHTRMTGRQVTFHDIDEAGRLVCYVELTGLPAPALRGLSDWFASYKVENTRLPVHTDKAIGKFVHTRELSPVELADKKEDLELLIQGNALGILTRNKNKPGDGQLYVMTEDGPFSTGDEKGVRLVGYNPPKRREQLVNGIQDNLARLTSPDQWALWAQLMKYYKKDVYPARKIKNEAGQEDNETHLPTLVCAKLEERAKKRLERFGLSTHELASLVERAESQLNRWTAEIPGSENDAYKHEIRIPSGDESRQPKRALRSEVFADSWRLADPAAAGLQSTATVPPVMPNPMPPAAPSDLSVPPPVQIPTVLYHLNVGGQNYGPFPVPTLQSMIATNQFAASTMVWREGMPAWAPASAVPELAVLFVPRPPSAPGMPPPFGGGMPPPMST
jgi:hypothetical protein